MLREKNSVFKKCIFGTISLEHEQMPFAFSPQDYMF